MKIMFGKPARKGKIENKKKKSVDFKGEIGYYIQALRARGSERGLRAGERENLENDTERLRI